MDVFIIMAIVFATVYLFFETLNLVVGNKAQMVQKRLMFALTSLASSGTALLLLIFSAG